MNAEHQEKEMKDEKFVLVSHFSPCLFFFPSFSGALIFLSSDVFFSFLSFAESVEKIRRSKKQNSMFHIQQCVEFLSSLFVIFMVFVGLAVISSCSWPPEIGTSKIVIWPIFIGHRFLSHPLLIGKTATHNDSGWIEELESLFIAMWLGEEIKEIKLLNSPSSHYRSNRRSVIESGADSGFIWIMLRH